MNPYNICKIMQLLWKTIWPMFKGQTQNYDTTQQSPPPWYVAKRTENKCSSKNLYMTVHSSFIQKVGTT